MDESNIERLKSVMDANEERRNLPEESTDPSPKFEQFEDWSQWTLALAEWVFMQAGKGEMSAPRLACVFDIVEYQAKQLSQARASQEPRPASGELRERAERFYNEVYTIGREDPPDIFKFASAFAAAERGQEWEQKYRQLLWETHCGGTHMMSLYGDDGEMQCNHEFCMIDFRREPIEQIEKRVHEANLRRCAPPAEKGRES